MPLLRRPNEHDTKCPDGFTCYGWRQVHKGGYVRFAHGRHYHEELAQFVGQWVYVILEDYLGMDVNVFLDEPFRGSPLGCMNESEWNKTSVTPSVFSGEKE